MSTRLSHSDPQPGATSRAARLAKGRAAARSWFVGCMVGGAVLLPALLGIVWLKFGRIDRLALGIAVGISTLIELFGVVQLVVRGAVGKGKAAPVARTHLQIQFCRRSLGRLGPGVEPLLTALREREHTPVVRECLNRCQDCNLGLLVATVDGAQLGATDGDKLLGELDELAVAEA